MYARQATPDRAALAPAPSKPLQQQTPAEHRQFCNTCIEFYVQRYGEIVCESASRLAFRKGVENAERFLRETFSPSAEKGADIDRSILEEIQSSVYRRRAEVLRDLTISFSG